MFKIFVFIATIYKYSGEGNGNPLQYSCQENPMGRGAWLATVHGVTRVRHDLMTKPPLPPGIQYIVLAAFHLL